MQESRSIRLILPDHYENTLIADFRSALKSLNITFRSCRLSTWSSSEMQEPMPLLFWLTDDSDLKSVVADLPPYSLLNPIIGIFVGRGWDWQHPALHRFNDIISWPCDIGELGFRLAKLGLIRQKQQYAMLSNMIGHSEPFQKIVNFVYAAAEVSAPILITGETGTGKEVVARAIHYQGPQKSHPFIPFNCGGVPEELLENELFGHEAGAFTSAQRKQNGLVAQAEGGTLFLDEIDALPLRCQVSLLRFLQDYEFRPLGGHRSNRAHLRIVAASNADLQELVEQRKFRQDLWYRLNVLTVHLPPLRERREDIPLLARHFMRQFCNLYRKPEKQLSQTTIQTLQAHSWPGNVRELENWIHRALLLGEAQTSLKNTSTSLYSNSEQSLKSRKAEAVHSFERSYLVDLMSKTKGNVTEAAYIAGTERRYLGKLLKKHGILASEFRQQAS